MAFMDAVGFAELTLTSAFNSSVSEFIVNKHKIERCLSFLSDEQSKVAYESELSFLMLRKVNLDLAKQVSPFTKEDWKAVADKWPEFVKSDRCPKMACSEKERQYLINMLVTTFLCEQYRYEDKVNVQKGEVFIDCGACFGDTALWAYKNGAKEVYSFEPSPFNFEVLKNNIAANEHDVNKCLNMAVGDSHCKIPFAAAPGMAGASYATDKGNIEVECVTLDDFFEQNKIKPTFLKLDIEGFELGALKGAAKSIVKYKPKLTVCLYHNTKDMWELPLYIKELVPEYKFYCRKNNVDNEFILYATTK